MPYLVPQEDSLEPTAPGEAALPIYVAAASEFRARLQAITPRIFAAIVLLAINVAVFVAMVATGVAIESPKLDGFDQNGAPILDR